MVSSLHLRILVPKEKEALHSTWLSWTSSASSPLSLWNKTRGLCKWSELGGRLLSVSLQQVFVTTGATVVFLCMCGCCEPFFNPPVRMCTWFSVFCLCGCMCLLILSVTSHFSPATCTWSVSWHSRWHCSERTAGSPSFPTGILCRLVVMTIPCLWWVATPAEALPFAPRRPSLRLLQLELRRPRGSCRKVFGPVQTWHWHVYNLIACGSTGVHTWQ